MSSYTPAHERANVATHLLGFLFGLVALPMLLVAVHDTAWTSAGDVWGAAAYGIGFLMVFGFSSLYHQVTQPHRKGVMKMWDHISIYFLIAGTYTPLLLAYADPADARFMLWLIWGFAAAGTLFKVFFTGRYRLFSTAIYLAMGWMVVIAPASFREALPQEQLWWLAMGGGFYSLGVVFYLVRRIPYHHAIWHVCVLGGAVSHYICIWKVFG